MSAFLDRCWLTLGSVKVTFVIFAALLLLSIPGTILLQENISNIDPGLYYDYEFWQLGQYMQLFRAYHSYWYVALLVLLSMNLIICSYERWPGMWRMAFAKARAINPESVSKKSDKERYEWIAKGDLGSIQDRFDEWARRKRIAYKILVDEPGEWQVFWEKHRLARLANYLVHTSLLLIFAGAIWSGLYGFEGLLNIPEGSAVDTFLVFKEGSASGLERPPDGMGTPNERMMDFRLEAESFHVEFYNDFPGRAKDFATKLIAIDRQSRSPLVTKTIRVNDPLQLGRYTFYQASYGELGDYRLDFRIIRKSSLRGSGREAYFEDQHFFTAKLGQVQKFPEFKAQFVPLKFVPDIEGQGPAVQVQTIKEDELIGEPFWVLKDDPVYDFGRNADWALVLDEIKPLYFTGLQVGYDPGAPIYWLGCLGMLLGTFYALFFQHKRYYVMVRGTKMTLTGATHRLPFSFEAELEKLARSLEDGLELKRTSHAS